MAAALHSRVSEDGDLPSMGRGDRTREEAQEFSGPCQGGRGPVVPSGKSPQSRHFLTTGMVHSSSADVQPKLSLSALLITTWLGNP